VLALGRRNIYYGWVMVFSLAVTEMISYGVLFYAFTVFITPIQAEFGWSRAEISGAFSAALLTAGLLAIPIGHILDRRGARVVMTIGACAAVLLTLGWSRVQNLTTFYIVWIGIGAAMALVLYEPAFAVVATWFRQKRGQALTILTFIAGFASVIFIPLAEFLIRLQGWRGALWTLAALLALTIPLHALILRRHPSDLGVEPDGGEITPNSPVREVDFSVRQAVRLGSFWWLTAAFTLNTLAAIAILLHLTPYLTDMGYSTSFAASATGLVGLLSLPGRLIFTMLGDYLPRWVVTTFLFLLQPLAFFLLLILPGTAGVYGFVIVFGACYGAVTPARAALVADTYGATSYGSISSILGLFLTFARALAPVGAGLMHDLTGDYQTLFWMLLIFSLIGAAFVPFTRRNKPPQP